MCDNPDCKHPGYTISAGWQFFYVYWRTVDDRQYFRVLLVETVVTTTPNNVKCY